MAPSAIQTGYRGARDLRAQLGLSESQPADPFWAADQLGIVVVRRPFAARNVAGLHVYQPDGDIAIAVINATDPRARQRFTMAHEIAHHIFDKTETFVDDLRTGKNLKEIRANCFAGEFLLPEAAIVNWKPKKPWAESPEDVAELAVHYGTSFEATLYRLKSAEYLTADQVNPLSDRLPELPREIRQKITERDDEVMILPTAFLEMAECAFQKKLISRGKYEELIRGVVEK